MSRRYRVLCVITALAALGWLAPGAQAQSFNEVIRSTFQNGGSYAFGGVAEDAQGNLYGATYTGAGAASYGLVYKLTPAGQETVLHTFQDADGANPFGRPLLDAAGNLYGTTLYGGAYGYGGVYKISAAGAFTLLHSFNDSSSDGAWPHGQVVIDAAGDLYGTTFGGGLYGRGAVYELALNTDGSYTEKLLHSFNGSDGQSPDGGLAPDAQGNLYGTTYGGGASGRGTVFKLDTSGNETVLYSFTGGNDGGSPAAGLATDAQGDLFGTTHMGGTNDAGTVFELANNNGTYTATVLHSFSNTNGDGGYPQSRPLLDGNGNVYVTTANGGASGYGTVFELAYSNGGYSAIVLNSFSNSNGDGAMPLAGLIMDSSGTLYGTTAYGGGPANQGTVFLLTTATNVATTTRISATPNPATAGDSVTLSAVVSSAIGLPSGTVTLMNGSTPLGTEPLVSGQATLAIEDADTLGIGSFSLSAQYTPASAVFAGSNAVFSETVEEAGAALTNSSNTFNGNQNFNGNLIVAPGFKLFGDGSGLTGIVAQTANYANTAGSANLAANASELDGVSGTDFARLDLDNSFQGNQAIAGNVTVNGGVAGGYFSTSGSTSTGSLTIGGGTAITGHFSILVNPNYPALTAGTCAAANFTLNGAADGDTLALGVPNERMLGGGSIYYIAWVSASNTITVKACNVSKLPQKTPGSGAIRVDLWKH